MRGRERALLRLFLNERDGVGVFIIQARIARGSRIFRAYSRRADSSSLRRPAASFGTLKYGVELKGVSWS